MAYNVWDKGLISVNNPNVMPPIKTTPWVVAGRFDFGESFYPETAMRIYSRMREAGGGYNHYETTGNYHVHGGMSLRSLRPTTT